jgi:hypothetical protein
MNEAHDPLEAELAALRPLDASPELRRRIDNHLDHYKPLTSRWRWSLAIAGGLAAACLVVVLVPRPGGRRDVSPPIDVVDVVSPPVAVEDSGPSLLAYQRALARSTEDLDALLSKHAHVGPDPNAALVRLCAFTRSDSKLQALLGDN